MDFSEMFKAIHGYAPFPWQVATAEALATCEEHLRIMVPTAAGKTALIDTAVHAALKGGPHRIAFIIDRRVVVDEAFDRACRIIRALTRLGICQERDIQAVRLRGGVHGDDDWVLYPERISILVSTVDQIGSRLLHRGYGVSPRMAPVHAGFVGTDSLYIIDEAHLSQPFLNTVEACRCYGADIRLVEMTATPSRIGDATIKLSPEDLDTPVLRQRLTAVKKARLVSCETSDGKFVKTVCQAALAFAKTPETRVIGIVVNRVAAARKIWATLNGQKHQAALLTGRIRPFDRDRLMNRLLPHIKAGRKRTPGPPLFIVATQTIEVGADIDFDALVSEAAPLDALRQRFGRLDRLGMLGQTSAAIVYREPKINKDGNPKDADPVYGMDIHDTWAWLEKNATAEGMDFGHLAIQQVIDKAPPPRSTPPQAPMLLPTHISLLSQTGPMAPPVDVSAWLHGAGSASSDVTLIWRVDLDPAVPEQWPLLASLHPPLTSEALEIPLLAAKAWLKGNRAQEVSDIEGVAIGSTDDNRRGPSVLRWKGPEDISVIYTDEIRPGDTVIVPAVYGGCDAYGWTPASKAPVKDIADWCAIERPYGRAVRLVPGLTGWLKTDEAMVMDAVTAVKEAAATVETDFEEEALSKAYSELAACLQRVNHPLLTIEGGRFDIESHPQGVILRGRMIDEIDGSLSTGVAVTLETHLEGAAEYAARLSQYHPKKDKIVAAARLHDTGKEEYRFQVMLHGDPLAAAAGPLLAKSGLRTLGEKKAGYTLSGLPRGFRHELASLALNGYLDIVTSHLIASHHGYGRPWFPSCRDEDALGARLGLPDSGGLRRFAELVIELNPWGLTGLELLLRAADARASMAEQRRPHD